MAKWVYLGKLKKNMPKGKVREGKGGRVRRSVEPLVRERTAHRVSAPWVNPWRA